MHSKSMMNKTKNKNTKKIKLRLKMLVGLQLIYLLDELSMSSKSSGATLCHLKKFKFPFGKTSRWKLFDVKLTQFAVRIAANMENNRVTTEKLGKGVLYFINTSTQICRSIETQKRIFFEFAKKRSQ